MFNTYVINLERDKEKYRIISEHLAKNNIKHIRFNAIDGKKKLSPELYQHVSQNCLEYCPFSVIGCGLSHIMVAKLFYNSDPNPYCLILEDDAKPLTKNTIVHIKELVKKAPVDWDIIRLYCQGFCNYDNNFKGYNLKKNNVLMGSNCAYLLSKKGAMKIISMKLNWHIDSQLSNNKNILSFSTTYPLFIPKSNISTSYINNNKYLSKLLDIKIGKYDNSIDWYLGNSVFREPGTKKVYNYYQIIGLIIVVTIIFILAMLLFLRINK